MLAGSLIEEGASNSKSGLVPKLLLLALLLLYLLFILANLVDYGHLLRVSVSMPAPSTDGGKEKPARQIAIVVVLKNEKAQEEFPLAFATLQCYAVVQEYPLHYIYMTRNGAEHMEADDAAWHTAVMEKCFAGIDQQAEELKNAYEGKELMLAHTNYEWVYVLDGDVGVADGTHRLEEWIDTRADVIFYEREWNWEIMAGSYLVKNSVSGRRFLNDWVNTHLASNLNADNGALHWLFIQLFATQAERDKCNEIYFEASRYVLDRHAINASNHEYYYRNDTIDVTVKLLPHGLQWSRDANADVCMYWSPGRDFMLHGWKKRNQVLHPNNSKGGRSWSSPFVDTVLNGSTLVPFAREEECRSEVKRRGRDGAIDRFWKQRWRAEIIVSREKLETQLAKMAYAIATRYANVIAQQKFYEIAQ